MGHVCTLYDSGEALLKSLRRESFDLLLVDWQLPGISGLEVVKAAREACGRELPILFVTQRSAEEDLVTAFAAGADDFMSKPLRLQELMARVKALLRRAYPAMTQMRLDYPPYRLDPVLRCVELNGERIELKQREYDLIEFLFQNTGRLLSRNHLRESVWGAASDAPSRTLDTHASRLRNRLRLGEFHGQGQVYQLISIYGLGYRLEVMPHHDAAPLQVEAEPS